MVYSPYFHVKTNVDGRLECSLDITGGEKSKTQENVLKNDCWEKMGELQV